MKKEDFIMIKQSEGFISATPLPTKEALHEFYADFYYQAPQSSSYQISYDDIELSYKRLKCDTLLYVFKEHGIMDGAFLDIGAGEGFLINAADQNGFSVTGIDFSSFGVEKFFPVLKKRLITGDIYESIDRLKSEGKLFMACSAINVLEHVIDPDLFLSKIIGVLNPKGLLAITVPNDFSALHKLLLEKSLIDREFWFGPPHHLHYFNTRNLPGFCASRGYTLVDAFSDFPIDFFLLHPGSNYVMDSKKGPSAHQARLMYDLMIAQEGMDKYINFYRSMFQVGLGRNITIMLRPGVK